MSYYADHKKKKSKVAVKRTDHEFERYFNMIGDKKDLITLDAYARGNEAVDGLEDSMAGKDDSPSPRDAFRNVKGFTHIISFSNFDAERYGQLFQQAKSTTLLTESDRALVQNNGYIIKALRYMLSVQPNNAEYQGLLEIALEANRVFSKEVNEVYRQPGVMWEPAPHTSDRIANRIFVCQGIADRMEQG